MWKKLLLPTAKLLLAVLIIVLLVKKGNISSANISELDPLLLAGALTAILLQNVLTALRWRSLLAAVGIKITVFKAVSLTMQGIFWMLFLPGGTLGGDLVKAGLAAKDQTENLRVKAAFSVIMDRICGFCGLALLSAVIAVIFLVNGFEQDFTLYSILFCTATAAPCVLSVIVWVMHGCQIADKIGFLQRFILWSNKITRGTVVKLLEAVNSFAFAWKKCLLWMVLSAAAAFPLFITSLILISAAVQGAFTVEGVLGSLLSGSIGEFAGIVPLTPGGIGVRDALCSMIYTASGVKSSAAAVIPVTFTFLSVTASLPGGIFALAMLINKKHCR